MTRPLNWILAAVFVSACGSSGPDQQTCCDLLIRGAVVIDGSGETGRVADIGIAGGKILFVGDQEIAHATRVIDADGLVAAPGFIDVHNHADERVTDPRYRLVENFLLQGVTTMVGGADGLFSPRELGDIIDAFERHGVGVNYAFYVGHNGIRTEIMGSDRRDPTPGELDAMRVLVREGMEMGAVGFSTGLMYEPGLFSSTEEVVELTREVAPFGGIYDSHTRDPVRQMLASELEAIEIGRRAGVPVKLAHLKGVGLANAGVIHEVMREVEAAREEGVIVVADQYPYDGAAPFPLHEFVIIDRRPGDASRPGPWRPSLEMIRAALADPARREEIRELSEQGVDGGFSWLKAAGYDGIRILTHPTRPELQGRYLQHLAQERGVDNFTALAELILNAQEPILVTGGAILEEDVRDLLVQDWVMVASDGEYLDTTEFAHPRSAGTFPRVLGHYVRDETLLSLPEAVRRMTSLPAEFLGLGGRGRICPSFAADIVIFDPETIGEGGGWADPGAPPHGIHYVIVNGEIASDHGRPTGVAAGQIIRKDQRETMACD